MLWNFSSPQCTCVRVLLRVFKHTCVHVHTHDDLWEGPWFEICCVITRLDLNCTNILRRDTQLMIQEADFIFVGENSGRYSRMPAFHSVSDSSARPGLQLKVKYGRTVVKHLNLWAENAPIILPFSFSLVKLRVTSLWPAVYLPRRWWRLWTYTCS